MFVENCYLFVTDFGYIVCEDFEISVGEIKMIKPLKLAPQKDGTISFTPMFLKEEWAIVYSQAIKMQIPAVDEIASGYKSAKAQVFSGIILADGPVKRI